MRRNTQAGTLILTAVLAGETLSAHSEGSMGDDHNLQQVIVTGSHIPRTQTPPFLLQTITSDDIAHTGLTTVGDVLRTLTADNSGTLPSAFTGGFAAGASGVSLRGLSVNSTLTLIDGLRTADYALPDGGVRSFVDLNSIQIGTIDRIEVLKDGASPLYGADAIAGVVNIVLKRSYQGLTVNAAVGDSQHGGGFEKHLDFTTGRGDLAADRYNVYISAEYQYDNAIGVWERPFPYNSRNYSSFGGLNLDPSPAFSAGSIYGSVTPATLLQSGNVSGFPPNYYVLTGVRVPGAVSQPLRSCPPSAPLTTSPSTGNQYCDQNQTLYRNDQPPTERFGASARMSAVLGEAIQGYVHLSYYRNQTTGELGPAQIQNTVPQNTNSIALPPTIPGPNGVGTVLNPNDPFAAAGQAALINYAFGDVSEAKLITNHNLRAVADLNGSYRGWNYDASVFVNHTRLDLGYVGFLNYTQLLQDVAIGTYSFVKPSANSPATLAALLPPVATRNTTDKDGLVMRGNRDLLRLSGGPLAVAVGAESRYEAAYLPNLNAVNGMPEVLSEGYWQVIGHRNIESAYAEVNAPLLRQFVLDAAGRFDHYSDVGNAATPKVAVTFRPSDSFTFNSTYSLGFRAPSFTERGAQTQSGLEGFVPYGACPSALCSAHGADGYVTSYTLGEVSTASASIRPERSKNFTVGLNARDGIVRASADYYYIRKSNLITAPNPSAALEQYASIGAVPPGYSVVYNTPDPLYPFASPRIASIGSPYINAPSEYTDGVDIEVRIDAALGSWGKLTSDASLTRILSFVYEQAGQPNLQYAGFQSPYDVASGSGTPHDRLTWATTWSTGPLTLSANLYFVGAYKMYGQDVTGVSARNTVQYICLTTFRGVPAGNCRVAPFTDIDVVGNYAITDHCQLSAMIQNAFDSKPPLDFPSYSGINYSAAFAQSGIVGRYFRLGVRFQY